MPITTLKQLAERPEPLAGGHAACAGCAFPQLIRMVLRASDHPVVCAVATGCMQVTTTRYPYTAWKVPLIHNAFENAAATLSGVEAAYRALRRRGKIDREIRFIAFAGDGGTYDIGLQALSGAMERGHRMLYVCYDNQAYMNTGIQRSSATPRGATTITPRSRRGGASPNGRGPWGKLQARKDLTAIMAAHGIPYVAQTTVGHWLDLIRKVQKALAVDGPSFLNVLTPCRLGWGFEPSLTVKICEMAVDSCVWPLYEVENGRWRVNRIPKEKIPLAEWLRLQQRFAHLLRPECADLLAELQREVDLAWERLLRRHEEGQADAGARPQAGA